MKVRYSVGAVPKALESSVHRSPVPLKQTLQLLHLDLTREALPAVYVTRIPGKPLRPVGGKITAEKMGPEVTQVFLVHREIANDKVGVVRVGDDLIQTADLPIQFYPEVR